MFGLVALVFYLYGKSSSKTKIVPLARADTLQIDPLPRGDSARNIRVQSGRRPKPPPSNVVSPAPAPPAPADTTTNTNTTTTTTPTTTDNEPLPGLPSGLPMVRNSVAEVTSV